MAPLKIGKFDLTAVPFAIPMLQFMTATMPSLALLYAAISCQTDYLQNLSMDFLNWRNIEEFDFIIVGGGSAGSVLANRLSKNNQVLLLEAGGEPSPLASIPGFAIYLQHVHGVDWEYYTVPQRNACLAMKENRSFWPRGFSLGGSSNLNFMIYERGNSRDYNSWVEETGNPQWSYENCLPFFKKSEDYHGYYKNDKFHSQGGPLYVGKVFTSNDESNNLAKYFVQAGVEMGHEHHDTNGYQQQGFGFLDVTIKDGLRWGTYTAFLKPVMHRNNLIVYRYSRVEKIHMDRTKTAYGVTFVRHGMRKFVRARKEIIISAGAVESPKLLMLSGIGLKPHLHSVGLRCRAHLPVGQNLQDHVLSMVGPFTINKTMSAIMERDSSLYNIREYFGGRGPLATPSAISAVGYFASSLALDRNWPDVQYLMAGLGVSSIMAKDLARILGYKYGYLEKFYAPNQGKDAFFVFTTLGKPRSAGEILLRNRDPWEKPLIDPKYYSHPDDMQIMVEGFRYLVDMIESTKMYANLDAKFAQNHFPGCERFPLKSDAYYECYLRFNTLTLYHPSGTCPMGRRINDTIAVVDSELRVLKTHRLRVIDASVMRTIPNANLNAPTVMIAEKGAFFIMNYWAQQYEVCIVLQYLLYMEDHLCFYSRFP